MDKTVIVLAIIGFLGLAALVVGGVMFPVFDHLIHDRVSKSIPLTNGSDSYRNWLDPSSPVYMEFTVFNVLNPSDIVKNGSKPVVEEMGPYVYREIRPKEDVEFLQNGSEISYRQRKTYVFEPGLSNGTEDDTFTTVNLAILTAAVKTKGYIHLPFVSSFLRGLLNENNEHLFEEFTVYGYLWGYEEKTLAAINHFTEKYLHIKIFKSDKIGLFYGKTGNGTDDGVYVINSGSEDVNQVNLIESWEGKPNVSYWKTEYCNMINGTDATLFHPFVEKDEKLYIFSSDICRSMYLEYKKEQKLKGISLHRFSPPKDVFADYHQNPDNIGFCVPDESGCLGSGVLDVSGCKDGAPIVLSQPHFYQGAEEYIQSVIGMHPTEECATHIDIEPNTGIAMDLAKKLQINALITKFKIIDDTKNFVNKTVFPILWLNENAQINDDDAKKFKSDVLNPMTTLFIVKIALIVVGGVVLLDSIIALIIIIRKRKADDVPLLSPSAEENE